MRRGHRPPLRADLLALGVVVLVVGLVYRRLLSGWVLAGGDLQNYFFPYWTAGARALRAGTLPLWNPYLFAGAPLLANSQMGAFYPLNWLLWLLSGPSLAGMARTLHASVLLHLLLAAGSAYLLARRVGASAPGAALSALLYAGGGYLGLHVEHLNQLQGLAWLPLVLLPPAPLTGDLRDAWRRTDPACVIALAMILLAGHTQTAFIAVAGLMVWRGGWAALGERSGESRWRHVQRAATGTVFSLLPFALAGLVAAAQLLPTFRLSRWSVRSGGLPWREAVSFSLRPWDLHRALLPPYLLPPLLPEGVAYVGLVGLVLAGWGAWQALRRRDHAGLALVLLGGTGLFLALGAYNPLYLGAVRLGTPGLVHFRAPARFLALYVLAASLLAGRALSPTVSRPGRRSPVLVTLAGIFVIVELVVAAERLPHADATALRAYTDLRPATAHLVSATQAAEAAGEVPGRFLSISQTRFDPGDEPEIEATYGGVLSPDAVWAFLVAAKQREVLTPNLSMVFAVPAVDGYDGGLLPTRPYVAFSRLLLPEGTLDGRLRENLGDVPEGRWLSLLGVRYLLTDKTGDAWHDDVFYDHQFRPALAPGETLTLGWLPEKFEGTTLALIYAGSGDVEVVTPAGVQRFALPEAGGEEVRRLAWGEPAAPRSVTIRATTALSLSGASLIDERTGAFYPLALSDRFRLAHSGDVKIYENLQPLPRAFVVHDYLCADGAEDALAALRAPSFDPARHVVLMECGGLPEPAKGTAPHHDVAIVAYAPTRVVVEGTSGAPGLLVLTDGWYPGWEALVETPGQLAQGSVPLHADLLFRAVPVPAGTWRVTFTYRASLVAQGMALSVVGLLAWLVYTRSRVMKGGG